jgi:hypothetical protein
MSLFFFFWRAPPLKNSISELIFLGSYALFYEKDMGGLGFNCTMLFDSITVGSSCWKVFGLGVWTCYL